MIDDLMEFANEYFFTQLIQQPTHRQWNTMDLIFSNNPMITHSCNIVDTRMAGMLSEQYKSAYSTPKESLPQAKEIFQGDQTCSHWLYNVTFDEEYIKEAIDQISSTTAAGPDRFPTLFLKMCKQSLATPLFIMWRKSVDTGEMPPF